MLPRAFSTAEFLAYDLLVMFPKKATPTAEAWSDSRIGFDCLSALGTIEKQVQKDGTNMSELVFLVEEAPEGGYTARALGEALFTEADTWAQLQENIREATTCHFDDGKAPSMIRLHFVRDEVIAL